MALCPEVGEGVAVSGDPLVVPAGTGYLSAHSGLKFLEDYNATGLSSRVSLPPARRPLVSGAST